VVAVSEFLLRFIRVRIRSVAAGGSPELLHKAGLCDAWMAFSLPKLACLSVSQARGLYQMMTFKKDSIDLYVSFEYKLDRNPSCRIVMQARVEDAR
jgi:hypothetical protein